MQYRIATLLDIPQIQTVRNSVKENTLSDPALVSDKDVAEFLTERGKGWVCEVENQVVGFAIVDFMEHNIWALFIHPDFEKRGIGAHLQQLMLNAYFAQTTQTVWLGTSPGTRAEAFYRKSGWREAGLHGGNEIKFELDYSSWKDLSNLLMK